MKDYDFKAMVEQEPWQFEDCNNCKHINITEKEQEDNVWKHHFCEFYHTRLFHRAIYRVHESYIYPCIACLENGCKNFVERE